MKTGAITAVSLNVHVDSDREFVVLTMLSQLKDLSLQHTEISTIGLEQLVAVRSLERLDLGHTLLGDNALPMLASLTSLRALELPSTLVEGTGLAVLKTLPNLREIDLGNAPIANEGMAQLAQRAASINHLRHPTHRAAGALRRLKNLTRLALPSVTYGKRSLGPAPRRDSKTST